MTTSRQVGIVGVGLMGHGIASSLLRAGHQVSFLNHSGNQPVDDLLVAGATALNSGREVAQSAEVVILCVTGSPQVEAVLFEPNGVLEGITPGSIVVDCSTALPSSTENVAARVTEAGGRFMDAAMTRTPKEAAEGRLNLIVGAPKALFDETLPLLQGFAENIAHAGDVGAGHTLKLLHNFVSLGFSAVLAEATVASRKAGISDTALLEVLGAGGGGGVVLERLRPYIADNDPSGFKFSVANASKDLGYYHTMTEDLAVEGGIAEAVRNLYKSVEDQSLPIPALIGVLERR
ncbi:MULTISPECIES: NAD(P)-dependent oxidoreductase [Halomonadaceae]|uniref:NAD(P)-dependent oxidoreductase n=1 Tax=Halomonadaceae TaxID=28256 RepID=UPI0012F0BC1C|nr:MULTISPECIES: NAD(P)-dependent oxidoreductase [Halomonas]CAD5259374.1 NAD-binding 6-phosphogluconate dehydrogenase [Halomonas sp. 59]CAD5259667.1 NAD-binding 6-phosphogluconate dehydrogenase [Halomonas sp. 113]CAD5273628.1 NAD-binding 6-phosphogluconate dehydrogenase [Halomonas sp. I3]CAD5289064.1 NAD-binding 6-phosphogluconate dehydrogenase [Halomonas sp. 156]VXB35494.1 NAD-binding 6-phosphogluconate dehydrogenase [Halomonas titanicae]